MRTYPQLLRVDLRTSPKSWYWLVSTPVSKDDQYLIVRNMQPIFCHDLYAFPVDDPLLLSFCFIAIFAFLSYISHLD